MVAIKTLVKDMVFDQIDSPVGCLTLLASAQGVHRVMWEAEWQTDAGQTLLQTLRRNRQHEILQQAKQQLQAYFDGKRQTFTLPLCVEGTVFQKQAWQVLRGIPYGETISYGEQANRLGDTRKARAVGMANGRNPLSIIVPCHRVIGSNGQLTGFGGGLPNKSLLLKLEEEHKHKEKAWDY